MFEVSGKLPAEQAWEIAIDHRGEVRERRTDGACADMDCGHRACWIEEAHVTELTGLLREGPAGGQLRPGSPPPWWAQILLAWLRLLALDGDLARAEPKTLRYCVLHAAARLVRGGRRRRWKFAANWPWSAAITRAWHHIWALPERT